MSLPSQQWRGVTKTHVCKRTFEFIPYSKLPNFTATLKYRNNQGANNYLLTRKVILSVYNNILLLLEHIQLKINYNKKSGEQNQAEVGTICVYTLILVHPTLSG